MLRGSVSLGVRYLSKEADKKTSRKIVVFRNNNVAAWHPEPLFPYEHTRPVETEITEDQVRNTSVRRFNRWKDGPSNVQLKNIFYTPKHEWFTRTREERLRSVAAPLPGENKYKARGNCLNFLLAVEHTPVYTIGIRSDLYSKDEENRLRGLGADFYRTSRGGLITFHGPGQLVMYPIFDLKGIAPRPIGVRRYVEMLEQVIIECACFDFGIPDVCRTQHTGVWVGGNRKLAALGIAVSHGVSYHGLALNCNTDLKWYDYIVGCGIEGAEATSLSKECNRIVMIEEAVPKMIERFCSVFDCRVQ